MGLNEFREDENQVAKYCNSRGLSAEEKDYLLQKVTDRHRAFDSLQFDDREMRFVRLTDQQIEMWLSEMSEGPTLF